MSQISKPRIFLISGPCGCGKSTLTRAFAQELAVRNPARQAYLVEGDLFHQGLIEGPAADAETMQAAADATEGENAVRQWDPLAPDAFAGKTMGWTDILAFNWDCILFTTERILQYGLDVVIDYVAEEELPRVQALAEKYQVPLYYIVLTASEETLRQRIQLRGDVEMVDRALFLKNQFDHSPTCQDHLLDNSELTIFQEIELIFDELERFRV